MNKCLILFSAAILLFSCKNEKLIQIKGKFENGQGKYLYILHFSNSKSSPDSVMVSNSGKFKWKTESDQLKDLALYFKQNDFLRLVALPGQTIVVEANADSLQRTATISGSEYSLQVKQLYDFLETGKRTIDSLNMVYNQYQNTDKLDSVLVELRKISQDLRNRQRLFFETFIRSNPGSPVSFIALSMQLTPNAHIFYPREDLYLFKMVDSALSITYPQSEMTAMLHSFVARMEEQQKNDKTLKPGSMAPEIALPSPKGDTIRLSSFRGRYVLLDFWAAWCKPCRIENPNLLKMYQKYRWMGKGFEIFQVSLDKSADEWKKAIKDDGLRWKHAGDMKFWSSPVVKIYGIKGIPYNYLIDPEGKIIAMNLRGEDLDKKLSEIFQPKK